MSMIKLTSQDLLWEELNEDKDLCGFDGSTNAASDGPPRRGNTSGAGSIAHYQGPCWIISEQRDPVTGTNKHILHFPIKPPLVATSTAQINVSVYLITEKKMYSTAVQEATTHWPSLHEHLGVDYYAEILKQHCNADSQINRSGQDPAEMTEAGVLC